MIHFGFTIADLKLEERHLGLDFLGSLIDDLKALVVFGVVAPVEDNKLNAVSEILVRLSGKLESQQPRRMKVRSKRKRPFFRYLLCGAVLEISEGALLQMLVFIPMHKTGRYTQQH